MNKIFPIAAALLLAACGFHLKGTGGISQPLPYRSWHIANGQSMQQALDKALRYADGQPTAEAGKAQAVLTVTGIEERKDIYTITRAAEINEYLMILRVEAQASVNGEPLGEPMTVVINRTMDYSNSDVLGKAEEEQTIWSEMRADAADQIVRRLTFLKAAP